MFSLKTILYLLAPPLPSPLPPLPRPVMLLQVGVKNYEIWWCCKWIIGIFLQILFDCCHLTISIFPISDRIWATYHFLVMNDDLWGRGPQCMRTNPSNPGNMQGDFLFTDQNSRVWKKVQISELAPPQKCQMEKKILTPFKFLSDTFRTLPVKKYTSPPKPG